MSTSAFISLDIHVPGGPAAEDTVSIEGVFRGGEVVGNYGSGADGQGFVESGGTTTPLQAPGASKTFVEGVTAAGEIYGAYQTNGDDYGFVDDNGVFTTILFPSAVQTSISGASATGVIFGQEQPEFGFPTQFVDDNGVFTPVAYPGAAFLEIAGVNAAGEIAGIDWEGATSTVFTDIDGSLQFLSNTPTAYTSVAGISDNGKIAGTTGETDTHGFIYIDGVVRYILPKTEYSDVAGISAAGEVVGSFTTQSGKSEGFVAQNGIVHAVNFSGISRFSISGVTNSGQLYGAYFDDNSSHQHLFLTHAHFF
jgi:hypothetical protein